MNQAINDYYHTAGKVIKDEPFARSFKLNWLEKMLSMTEEELHKAYPHDGTKADIIQCVFSFTDPELWDAAFSIGEPSNCRDIVRNLLLILLPEEYNMQAWQREMDIINEL